MRTCVLHIGAPKAGSTTIQGLLGDKREALGRRGIDVPDFGFGDVVRGPIALIGALGEERDPARPATEHWRWLDRRLAETSRDVSISREAIGEHFVREAEFDFVKAFFEQRGFRLKLVLYLRDHAEFFNASYTQRAKKLYLSEDFDPWAERMIAAPPARFSYWRMLRHALKHDGVEVVATPLDQVSGDRLAADFCGHLGVGDLDLTGFDAALHRNPTPGPLVIAAALRIARALAARGLDVEAHPTISRDFERMAAARGWRERPFWGPDAETAARIRACYAEENERLARRLWRSSWAEAAPARNRAQVRADAPTPRERRAIDDLVREFVDHATRKPFVDRLIEMVRPRRA